MLKEHGVFAFMSSSRPIDETIRRGFVDAAAQSPEMASKTFGRKGTRYPRPADKTLNFAAVA